MKQKYTQFFLRLTILTVVIGGICWILSLLLPENTVSPTFPYLLVLFYMVTALIHVVLLKITSLNPRRFVSYFMLATFAKLIIYFSAVLIYVFTVRENILSFILTFFIIYIFFTVFEVALILMQTKES